MAFLSRVRFPASGEIRIFSVTHESCAGSSDLVTGNHISILIPADIHRPYHHLFLSGPGSIPAADLVPASVGSVKIPDHIGHTGIGIHQGIPGSIPSKMIHVCSRIQCQNLVFFFISDLSQVPSLEFQEFRSSLPGKGLVPPISPISFRLDFQPQITEIIVQNICVRTHHRFRIPDISLYPDDFPEAVHASRPRCRIKPSVFILLREKFCFPASVSFLYVHTLYMPGIITPDHQSFICKILGITGRREGNGIKQRHQCTGRISGRRFRCGLFPHCRISFCLCSPLFYHQADRLIFQINPRGMDPVLRLVSIGCLLVSLVFINGRKHPAVLFSVLIIGNLV